MPQTQSQKLDPQAVMMAQAIRGVESGNNPTAKGASGEHGSYQYTAPTWAKDSAAAGVNVPLEQASKEQQNQVAYTKIKSLKDKGYNLGQVASSWNAGEGEPDAYTGKFSNGRPSIGVNSHGVKFDVPAYAKSVAGAYQKLKGGQQVGADPNNPSSIASPNIQQKPEDKTSLLGKLVDFAFPIIGDVKNDFQGKSTKSPLQQIGDAGLSALWFAPGVGELGEGAIGAARFGGLLGETGTKVAGQALGGAATGYGVDVASKLSQGETDPGKVLTPGLGAATGGVLGGALGKLGSKYSEEGVVKDITKSNNSVLGQTKRGATDLAESFAKGKDPGELIAKKGINLANEYNPETVAFETQQHATNMRKDAGVINEVLTDALKEVPGTVKTDEFELALLNKVTSTAPDKITAAERAQLVKDEFSKVRSTYGEELSAAEVNELKKRSWDLSKFDAATTNETRRTHRLIGNTYKTAVEKMAKQKGLEGVGEMNELMGSHYDAADALDRLHGSKAKGGRLGDTLLRTSLETAGGIGGFFGGGPVGSLIGILAGHYGGKVLAKTIRAIESSPLKTAILNRIEQEDPEIFQKMLQYAKKTPMGIEASKEAQLAQKTGEKAPKNTYGIISHLLTTAGAKSVQ